MRDTENAKAGCAALSVAIVEVAEQIVDLAASVPPRKRYAARAAALSARVADMQILAAAMAVLARTRAITRRR